MPSLSRLSSLRLALLLPPPPMEAMSASRSAMSSSIFARSPVRPDGEEEEGEEGEEGAAHAMLCEEDPSLRAIASWDL